MSLDLEKVQAWLQSVATPEERAVLLAQLTPGKSSNHKRDAERDAVVMRLVQQGIPQTTIATQFGVSKTVISKIVKRNKMESI